MSILLLSHNTPEKVVLAAEARGFRTVVMPPVPSLPSPVASHPDMLLFCRWNTLFVRAAHMERADFSRAVEEIISAEPSLSLSLTSDDAGARYPGDIAFNCTVIGGALVGLADHISPAVRRAASANLMPVVNVAQGYAKCSTAHLGDGARAPIISADETILRAARERGVPAYKIMPGGVSLPGYDTGFFGGASFFADGTLYTLGDVDQHPSAETIKDAALTHGVRVHSLSDQPLFDSGCLYIGKEV